MPQAPAERLAALRAELATRQLDGFVVPLTDEHMSEYVGAYAQRLAWLTGFQGSAGTAVILAGRAAIFVDGRYTIQVREQVDGAHWDYVGVPATSVGAWLAANAPAGARIGFDPWLHSRPWLREARALLDPQRIVLVPVADNPVDRIWADRPAPSAAPIAVHAGALAGEEAADKRAAMAAAVRAAGGEALIVTALDSIAWLLNLRGADVAHTPVALAFAVLHGDGQVDLFTAPEKVTGAVRAHLGNGVAIRDRAAFTPALAELAGKPVLVDPERAVVAIFDALDAAGATIIERRDPIVLAKACKNPQEIAGHRAAAARDGAALARFLHWVEREAPNGALTELGCAEQLLAFRRESGLLLDTSFDTISATGAHGAIPHYHVDAASNAPLLPGQLYLVDSGGQYADGTTDVTRVVPVTEPSAEQRDRFTRVLKGHIALATATFPPDTIGSQLDAFARRPLWEVGLDYGHGTGHGVGAYLAVHEGPQRIAKPDYPGGGPAEPLRPGMIISNEPGYYKAGDFGIRIENLILVVERTIGEAAMLGFETLTFCPIERRLIDAALLSPAERGWVDAYHGEVLRVLGPQLSGDDHAWLVAKCAPL